MKADINTVCVMTSSSGQIELEETPSTVQNELTKRTPFRIWNHWAMRKRPDGIVKKAEIKQWSFKGKSARR